MPPAPYTVAEYVQALRAIHRTGSATAETSFYPPLDRLFNAVGETLEPKVLFFTQLRTQGACPTVASSPSTEPPPATPPRSPTPPQALPRGLRPHHLHTIQLTEVLELAGESLNRVEPQLFDIFQGEQAVAYFYEPFLQAFEPQLPKDLGVWYTPREIVHYMVGRVDHLLRTQLAQPLGLANPALRILDPCDRNSRASRRSEPCELRLRLRLT